MIQDNILSIPLPLPPFYRREDTHIGSGPGVRGPSIEITLWVISIHFNLLILRDGGHTYGHRIDVHRNRSWRFGFWWSPWVSFLRAPNDRITAIWSTSTHARAVRLENENTKLRQQLDALIPDQDEDEIA